MIVFISYLHSLPLMPTSRCSRLYRKLLILVEMVEAYKFWKLFNCSDVYQHQFPCFCLVALHSFSRMGGMTIQIALWTFFLVNGIALTMLLYWTKLDLTLYLTEKVIIRHYFTNILTKFMMIFKKKICYAYQTNSLLASLLYFTF